MLSVPLIGLLRIMPQAKHMYITNIRGINELKHSYKIKLYRSPLFRILCFVLMIMTLAQLSFFIYELAHYGFHDYFFGNVQSFLGGVAYPMGVIYIIEYVLTVVLDVFFLYILFLGAFMNEIKVRKDDVFMLFPPRIFYRIYKVNIHSIEPVECSSLSVIDRIFSFNFAKGSLYKVTCYDTDFVICSKDSENIQKLAAEIHAMGNIRECDEKDFDPHKLTKREKAIIGIVGTFLLYIIQNIYDFIF